jgi:hypothetical protein
MCVHRFTWICLLLSRLLQLTVLRTLITTVLNAEICGIPTTGELGGMEVDAESSMSAQLRRMSRLLGYFNDAAMSLVPV